MPGPIRDSWSKAQPPSVYDIVRNPRAMYQAPPRVQAGTTKDVLESTQQRLNREISEKWHANAFRLPHDTFVVVAKVGKYMFLAIMLPPYIFFYGIPKWLLQIVLPQSVAVAKNEFVRIGRFLSMISTHVIDLMKGVLKQTIGDAIRIFNRKARQFLRSTALQLKSIAKNAVLAFQRPVKRMMHPLVAAVKQVYHFYQKNAVLLRKTYVRQKDRVQTFFEKLKNKIKDGLRILHQHTLHPIVQWMVPKVAFIHSRAKKVLNKTRERGKKIAEKISNRTKALTAASKVAANWVMGVVSDVVQPIIQWMIPAITFLKPYIYEGKFKKAVQPIASKGKNLRRKIEDITSEAVEMIESILSDTAHYCSFKLLPPFQKWRNKKLKQGRSLRQFALAKAQQLSQILTKFQQRCTQWFWHFLGLLKKFLGWLKDQSLSAPRRIGRRLIQGLHLIRNGSRNTFYGIRWLVTFLWIVFKYGMLLVQELASDIGNVFGTRK